MAEPRPPAERILPADPLGPPARLVARGADRFGSEAMVAWCLRLIHGEPARAEDPDLSWLGGHAGWDPEWLRVWGLRALRYLPGPGVALPPAAADAVAAALHDPSFLVREMACQIAGERGLLAARGRLLELRSDEAERVRRQAERALRLLDAPV